MTGYKSKKAAAQAKMTDEEYGELAEQYRHEKPVVYFTGEAYFEEWGGHTIAYLDAIDHPHLGSIPVRTSSVQSRNDDGSFETLNTIYKPAPQPQRTWVGLTDGEIAEFDIDPVEAKALIQKLKEKNT